MELGPWLKLIHIAAAMAWLGGGLTLAVIGVRARRSGDATLLVAFGRTVQYVGLRVLGPAMGILLVAGISLVLVEAHSFTEPWILLALGGFAFAFVVGGVLVARSGIELRHAVDEASPDATRLRFLAGRWVTGYSAVLAILLFVLWDMVFKPGR
jgi:uncharacterized membrane protein